MAAQTYCSHSLNVFLTTLRISVPVKQLETSGFSSDPHSNGSQVNIIGSQVVMMAETAALVTPVALNECFHWTAADVWSETIRLYLRLGSSFSRLKENPERSCSDPGGLGLSRGRRNARAVRRRWVQILSLSIFLYLSLSQVWGSCAVFFFLPWRPTPAAALKATY